MVKSRRRTFTAEHSPQRGKSLCDTVFKRQISSNNGFRHGYNFEAGLHVKIKLKVAIARGMRSRDSVLLQTPPRSLFRASAFHDSPGLVQRSRSRENIFDLIAPRERTSVEKDAARRFLPQQISGSLKHHLNAEIVLPRRVFDLIGRKKRVANVVLADDAAEHPGSEFARKCSFAGAGKPGHQDDHDPLKHDSLKLTH